MAQRRSCLFTALMVIGSLPAFVCFAQSNFGHVVFDPAGKTVPGAQVTLKSLDAEAAHQAISSVGCTQFSPSRPGGTR